MKNIFFFLMLAAPVFAAPRYMVTFPAVTERVSLILKTSECQTPKKVTESYYQIHCKTGSVPVMLIQEFKYPSTILTEIKGTTYEDVKKLGDKAIKKKVHAWGNEYWWETPTSEKSYRTYYCPKNKNHCYYVVHDGSMEFMVSSK